MHRPLRGARLSMSWLPCALWVLVGGVCPSQVSGSEKPPLRILFLGEPDAERGRDFVAFLGSRFATVEVADRWAWHREALANTDVVLLDWPQQDGVSKWLLEGDRTVEPRSPLGVRSEWSIPTVLVGSAGLNVAWSWDVKGAFG